MKQAVAALAALGVSLAWAQQPHSHGAATAKPPGPAASAVPAPAPAEAGSLYRSAFSGYRGFAEEVKPKDWRKANEEVREAGGHLGLMKGEPAQLKGHGSHGAKQPSSDAGGRAK